MNLLISGVALAGAAEVTRLPEPGHLEAGVVYRGETTWGGLQESGVRVSDVRAQQHDLGLQAEVAPIRGLAVYLRGVATPVQQRSFPRARPMVWDPATSSGSYLIDDAESSRAPAVTSGGLAGIWVGAAVGPFGPQAPSSWRLDLSVRTPGPRRTLWAADGGSRGVGVVGPAVRVAAAFAVPRGGASPYLRAAWVGEGPVSVDVVDPVGGVWVRDLRVQPASTVDVAVGAEVALLDRDRLRLALDGWLGGQALTQARTATGVQLPWVIDAARGIPVTVGDQVALCAGAGMDLRLSPYLHGRAGITGRWGTPYQVEHSYPVRTTADTMTIGGFLEIEAIAPL